jgi:hypothetical protein
MAPCVKISRHLVTEKGVGESFETLGIGERSGKKRWAKRVVALTCCSKSWESRMESGPLSGLA